MGSGREPGRIGSRTLNLRWARECNYPTMRNPAMESESFTAPPTRGAWARTLAFFRTELAPSHPGREQPVVQLHLHSNGAASSLAALLLPQILPICSVVAPCHRGASPFSVRRWTCTTGC